MRRTSSTIDPGEIACFAGQGEDWWDSEGSFRTLHRVNPVRLGFIRQHLAAHFCRDRSSLRPFDGLTLLDIGCGGGLVAEPMARLGFAVTGIDASTEAVDAARTHAEAMGLAIDYRVTAAESFAAAGRSFDTVLALEVIEHVADPADFFAALSALVRPGVPSLELPSTGPQDLSLSQSSAPNTSSVGCHRARIIGASFYVPRNSSSACAATVSSLHSWPVSPMIPNGRCGHFRLIYKSITWWSRCGGKIRSFSYR